MTTSSDNHSQLLLQVSQDILSYLEQDREKEIIARRFGLNNHPETLEQIGEFLGITRERVRQLEKAILIRLKIAADEDKLPSLPSLEKVIIRILTEQGRILKTADVISHLTVDISEQLVRTLAFVAEVSNKLTLIEENDSYHQAVAIAEFGDTKTYRKQIDEIVSLIKTNKKPMTIDELDQQLNFAHPDYIRAEAKISKKLAQLNNHWGLFKWPSVNPRNIKDKIYVVLSQANQPLHFSDIAKQIADSDFQRKNVTKQAIHNELIKDKRFVLIGRGIYALNEWGYSKGTVADIIAAVIQENGEPMYRDDIVKQVLKRRKVKETTVLLNLQARPEFKRVAKATYDFIPKV